MKNENNIYELVEALMQHTNQNVASAYKGFQELLSPTEITELEIALKDFPVEFDNKEISVKPSDLIATIGNYIYKDKGPSYECWQKFGGSSDPLSETLTLASIASKHYEQVFGLFVDCDNDARSNETNKVYNSMVDLSRDAHKSYEGISAALFINMLYT